MCHNYVRGYETDYSVFVCDGVHGFYYQIIKCCEADWADYNRK